jgi:hypothetical protein
MCRLEDNNPGNPQLSYLPVLDSSSSSMKTSFSLSKRFMRRPSRSPSPVKYRRIHRDVILMIAVLLLISVRSLFCFLSFKSEKVSILVTRTVDSESSTVLRSNGMCESHEAKFSQTPNPVYTELTQFLSGPVEPSTSEAICVFTDDKISAHFPHAMQQLYACWSYWQHYKDKRPVLNVRLDTNESLLQRVQHFVYRRRSRDKPFLSTFWRLLEDVFQVEIRHNSPETVEGVSASVPDRWSNVAANERMSDGYAMLSGAGHAAALRDGLLETTSCPSQVRIGLLNRKQNRSLLNIVELQDAIQLRFPGSSIALDYFEGKTFGEQIQFFGSVDILVSPHGAQLTGIPFMPTCGQVLEIFPEGYLIPTFFGSLAEASDLGHAYMYLGDSNQSLEEVQSRMMEDRKQRSRMRQANLCPVSDQVADSVEQLMEQWQNCCHQYGMAHKGNLAIYR